MVKTINTSFSAVALIAHHGNELKDRMENDMSKTWYFENDSLNWICFDLKVVTLLKSTLFAAAPDFFCFY